MSKKPNDYIELVETRPQSSNESKSNNSYIERKNGYQSVDLYSSKASPGPRGLASTSFNDSNSYIDIPSNTYAAVSERPTDINPSENSNKSIVLGGIEGILASFIILSGCSGAKLSWGITLLIGISSVLTNALATGLNEFLSSRAHRSFIQAEKRRATWQYKNFLSDEKQEMIARLEGRGMTLQDAELVVNKFASYQDVFVNFLLIEELGMNLPDEDEGATITDAAIMLISYAFFGILPFVIHATRLVTSTSLLNTEDKLYIASCVYTGIVVCTLGGLKGNYSSSIWIYTAFETLVLTAVCGAAAYSLAYFLENHINTI